MQFPYWIDQQQDKRQRARLRLKFMLSHATLRKYGRTSIHDLARDVQCNHSSVFNAIARGYFTTDMAERIERVLGRTELRHEWLVDPLNVEATHQ